jgi:hypothetical protein
VTLVFTGEAIGGGERYRGGVPASRPPRAGILPRLVTGPLAFFLAGVVDVAAAWLRWGAQELAARLERRAAR